MASDYASIRTENELRYGTDIGRIGRMLLADRYDDRTHFIYELLQNAEDALARRLGGANSRAVSFTLSATTLRVAHCGLPFDDKDVGGICGIAESTKGLSAIGRFGIGFKSVYTFTDRPEVHSGGEDFAIESYVWPVAVPVLDRQPDETVFILPLNASDVGAHAEIVEGLRRLGPRTLLFLRQIEEIAWKVEDGPSGLYVRGKPEEIGENVRRVVLLGEEEGKPDVEETWLLFSHEAKTPDGATAGHVEIAFSIKQDDKSGRNSVQPVIDSPLVVFFPTVVSTNLGFLVQGPYRTTPSRDNVPPKDAWNQHLAGETATLLREALLSLRTMGLLDVDALSSLPIDRAKFAEGRLFAPMFEAVLDALRMEPLLPVFGTGHATAGSAKLARTQELRELLAPGQLATIFGSASEVVWLSGDITQDRTPELRQFLMHELAITEVTPELMLPRLTRGFLEQQTDEWTRKFYEFLHGQPALVRLGRLKDVPLVRLEDGRHVTARKDGQAFLPGPIATGFPTVRSAVCGTEAARALLVALGLTEPDPVDDVVWNILPKYHPSEIDIGDAEYEADISRIMSAMGTDSKGQRDKLLGELRKTNFVMAIDAADGQGYVSKPTNVYIATERLKKLFASVPDVLLVDDAYACLRGEDIREMLEACGALRYLRPIEVSSLSWQEKNDLRIQAGHEITSGVNDRITDWTLSGLNALLDRLPGLEVAQRKERAGLLWEELANLEERRGKGIFFGEYTWTHYGSYRAGFDAAFVRLLNSTAWVPDASGDLKCPESVIFDSLDWKPNAFLLSRIRFKPPIIDQLAKEAGIEPGLLDLLKTLGLTSEAELRDRLGLKEEPAGKDAPPSVDDALKKLLGDAPVPTPPLPDPTGDEPKGKEKGEGGGSNGTGGGGGGKGTGGTGDGKGGGRTTGSGDGGTRKLTPGGTGGRPFISYLATEPNDEGPDPDGLDQPARMVLEAQAIDLILSREQGWQRTPANNPGFDLFVLGADTTPARWCEVKAMTGSLHDRPVGLSHTQFDCAREHGQAYWLYVVERAGAKDARIVRIQDPAGKARTFTFDHGWLDIAAVDTEQEHTED